MFSSPSSSLLASLFSSSPIFHPPPAIYSNSSAFIVPSSSSSSIASSSNAVSDAFRSLSLQLLLDQHRNSLLRSILALTTSTVPVDANNPYSTPTDDCQKTEFLLSNVEAEKAAAAEGSDGEKRREAENDELKKEKKREGRKRPRKERRLKDERNRKILRLHKGETETDSPVSGMFIREFCDEEELRQATAELDESAPFCNRPRKGKGRNGTMENANGRSDGEETGRIGTRRNGGLNESDNGKQNPKLFQYTQILVNDNFHLPF
uniref:Uncharacterized protein n=1 Tax=Globodera pallida TaxID=36090 RepID=A0A183BTK9_GLOPA